MKRANLRNSFFNKLYLHEAINQFQRDAGSGSALTTLCRGGNTGGSHRVRPSVSAETSA